MADPKFVHLHVHTHYSMLDGACKIQPLVKRAKDLKMDALAITDHGAMYGAVEFYMAAKENGIKPIIGIEAYMAPGDRRDKNLNGGNAGDAAFHVLLLAQNLIGYKNLLRLSRISYLEGFYYKPRIDKATLREFSEGIICTSACLGGEVANAFMRGQKLAQAKTIAESYLDIFGPDRFFIEVQKHIPEQNAVNPELVEIANKLGVGVVGTNDVHFLNQDDHAAHNCLCCISTGKLVSDETRLKYPTELYLKSPKEMHEAMSAFPGAVDNTLRIAEMCNLELDFSKRYAPVYRVPKEKLVSPSDSGTGLRPVSDVPKHRPEPRATDIPDDERYLRQLCEEGLDWRYGTREVSQEIRDRLAYEINTIAAKQFCSYFLIVWDFCNHARDNGIPVGARGSGVGTMVGYLLGLCNVDPLKYGLLFERFMDPSRNEMPDIDIDICQDGRARIIEYVRKKYGHVAQIVTFGTLAAKAACKDVGRVLGVPLADVDKLTKLIPAIPGMTIDRAIESVPDLRRMLQEKPELTQLIETAKKLEGMCRNAGVHAAGVIIADQPLDDLIPLCRDKEGNVLTQYEGPIAEKCGLLKMDFLGLRTLSVLTRSLKLVKDTTGIDFDIEKVDFTDPHVLKLFCRGETKGVFQFESGGMQDLLMKMQPDRLEDLIAANALYRPGPMELIPTYCNRKHGREEVPKVHPIMDNILAETYGIMVYQEQVMQIFNQLGGIELASAYKLIKAISKKTSDVIAKFKPAFINGCKSNGLAEPQAREIFDLILKFGGYGFNKSHSTRYAIVAYQTAYMKHYHPVQYMAALLTYEMGSSDKMVEYIEECRRMRVPVLPPDVNESGSDFTPVLQAGKSKRGSTTAAGGSIRFGLCAIRGVGEKAVQMIVDEREKAGSYKSIYGFCDRVDTRAVQKATLDALVRCGAMSSVHDNRAALLMVAEGAYEAAQRIQADKASGQNLLFGGGSSPAPAAAPETPMPAVSEYDKPDLLQWEKELLGFYITSHPLTERADEIEAFATQTTRSVANFPDGAEVLIGGMIGGVRTRVGKTGKSAGQRWAIIDIEDVEGKIEGMVFSELFGHLSTKQPDLIKTDAIALIRGKVDKKREQPCIVVTEIISLADAAAKMTQFVVLKVDGTHSSPDAISMLGPIVQKHKGSVPFYAQISMPDGVKLTLEMGKTHRVRPSAELVNELGSVLPNSGVTLVGEGTIRKRRQEQQKLFDSVSDAPAHEESPTFEPDLLEPVEV